MASGINIKMRNEIEGLRFDLSFRRLKDTCEFSINDRYQNRLFAAGFIHWSFWIQTLDGSFFSNFSSLSCRDSCLIIFNNWFFLNRLWTVKILKGIRFLSFMQVITYYMLVETITIFLILSLFFNWSAHFPVKERYALKFLNVEFSL